MTDRQNLKRVQKQNLELSESLVHGFNDDRSEDRWLTDWRLHSKHESGAKLTTMYVGHYGLRRCLRIRRFARAIIDVDLSGYENFPLLEIEHMVRDPDTYVVIKPVGSTRSYHSRLRVSNGVTSSYFRILGPFNLKSKKSKYQIHFVSYGKSRKYRDSYIFKVRVVNDNDSNRDVIDSKLKSAEEKQIGDEFTNAPKFVEPDTDSSIDCDCSSCDCEVCNREACDPCSDKKI